MKIIIICTVGGSHQPILKSILESKPDYVCFICTGPDLETGQAGSERQIEGKGNVISMKRGEPPSLPNIRSRQDLVKSNFLYVGFRQTISIRPSALFPPN